MSEGLSKHEQIALALASAYIGVAQKQPLDNTPLQAKAEWAIGIYDVFLDVLTKAKAPDRSAAGTGA